MSDNDVWEERKRIAHKAIAAHFNAPREDVHASVVGLYVFADDASWRVLVHSTDEGGYTIVRDIPGMELTLVVRGRVANLLKGLVALQRGAVAIAKEAPDA